MKLWQRRAMARRRCRGSRTSEPGRPRGTAQRGGCWQRGAGHRLCQAGACHCEHGIRRPGHLGAQWRALSPGSHRRSIPGCACLQHGLLCAGGARAWLQVEALRKADCCPSVRRAPRSSRPLTSPSTPAMPRPCRPLWCAGMAGCRSSVFTSHGMCLTRAVPAKHSSAGVCVTQTRCARRRPARKAA